MSNLRTAAQHALDALELAQTEAHWELHSPTRKFLRNVEKSIRGALAKSETDPLDMPLEDFLADLRTQVRNTINASVRNSLIWHGDRWIKKPRTVRDLMMYSRGEIQQWPGIGKRALSEIDGALWNIGLQLRWVHDEQTRSLLRGQPTVVADPPRAALTDEELIGRAKARGIHDADAAICFGRAVEAALGHETNCMTKAREIEALRAAVLAEREACIERVKTCLYLDWEGRVLPSGPVLDANAEILRCVSAIRARKAVTP